MSKRERPDWEARFHLALRRITAYMSPEQLERRSEKTYGLNYEEALAMAYENVIEEARSVLHGYRPRKPKVEAGTAAASLSHNVKVKSEDGPA